MYIKKGVSIKGLQAEMAAALVMLSAVTNDFVITGGTESAPGRIPDSLHNVGLALDIRIPQADPDFPGDLAYPAAWKAHVSATFDNTEFDLVWYDDHVHIEFDPR